jgi:hypothetical protein
VRKNYDRAANLLGGTIFLWLLVAYFHVVKPYGLESPRWKSFTTPLRRRLLRLSEWPYAAWYIHLALGIGKSK